ncbi:hypothetical protein [Candidatus Entotheonella palauensis]|uniref:hypothetical protein n=1 Tax=Candidatus Entotheonella palauensis TaxID=93172 RepID=UPI000B7D78D8|nr:hypothetical protein [Candidatus Entotheonella palauensis]
MADALYLHLQGPDAESVLPHLNEFFQTHAALTLQPLPDIASGDVVRGLSEQSKKLYTFVKESREWLAAGATVTAALVALFAASVPQPSSYVEQVKATRELLQEVNKLNDDYNFSLELVDARTGAVLRLDSKAAPAKVIEFCQQAQEAAP